MKPRKILLIEWLDACERGDDNIDASDVGTGTLLESYGAFVAETKSILSIGMDYDPEAKKWRRVSDIPKKLISKRVEVTVAFK